EVQRDWARRFLEAKGLLDEPIRLAIDEPDGWYRCLAARLAERSQAVLSEWNRLRTLQVTKHVASWCRESNVQPALVVDSEASGNRLREGGSADLRSCLLKSIEAMSTQELLELRIPARCMISALRPDLL